MVRVKKAIKLYVTRETTGMEEARKAILNLSKKELTEIILNLHRYEEARDIAFNPTNKGKLMDWIRESMGAC